MPNVIDLYCKLFYFKDESLVDSGKFITFSIAIRYGVFSFLNYFLHPGGY